MTPDSACASCGTPLTAGFCARCLLAVGTSPELNEVSTEIADGAGVARLGDYELVEEIGRGGMGIVYRGRQVSLDRVVAIKLLPFGGLAGKDAVLRLRAEAVAAGSLRHPNIVAIHEVGLQDGQHFIAMDYVAGPSLARVLRDGPLPPQRAAILVRQAALAVQHAHERGIIHRDLKPSNILLDPVEDQPRITDFGLAKNLRSDTQLTLTGQTLGSPNYIPPEQIRGNRLQQPANSEPELSRAESVEPSESIGRVSFASDVYALGAILYHAVTGRPPFVGDDIASVLQQVLQDEPLSPRRLDPSVPADLETICCKCLEKEAGRRYDTAKELAEELTRFLDDEPIRARPVTRPERAWRWCRKNPSVATLTGVTVLLLLMVAGGGPVAAFRINGQRRQAELRAYTADMNVVHQAWEEGNLRRAQALLRAHIPQPGQPDLRGLEWRLLWHLCQDQSLATLTNFTSAVRSLCFTADGRSLLVGIGKLVELLDPTSYRQQAELWDEKGSLRLLATCPASPHLLATAGGQDSRVQLWELPSRKLMEIRVGPPINALALSPEGQLLAWACETGSIEVWDVRGQTKLWRHQLEHPSRTLAFSHDGETLVSGGSEHGGNALFWQARTGAELPGVPPAHGGWLHCTAFSPDGRTLATSGEDETLILWDFVTHRRLHTFTVNALVLAFSPDGHSLAVGGGENLLRLWDLTEPEKLPVVLHGHRSAIAALAFTPDGRALLSGDNDGAVKLWTLGAKSDPNLLMKAERYQHGTTMMKNQVPSRGTGSENALGLLCATSGYVSLLPDYLGLGDSPGFQTYLHARTEATAVVDMLRAARNFCASNSVNLNSQLFLCGYSQGGHATMAAHRDIETYHSDEFSITAVAPMAGSYDVSGATFEYVRTNHVYPFRGAVPLLITALLPIYELGDTLEELLRAPYNQTLAPLMDDFHPGDQIDAAMPADLFTILRPDYMAALFSDPNHSFRQALRGNDVYRWTPVAPMRFTIAVATHLCPGPIPWSPSRPLRTTARAAFPLLIRVVRSNWITGLAGFPASWRPTNGSTALRASARGKG